MIRDPFLSKSTRVFLAVVLHRSFSKAAAALGITQSAVSQTIAMMEKNLDIVLFDRSTRPLTPTKEAELLYEALAKKSTDMRETLLNLQNSHFARPFIRVGVIESLGRLTGPRFVRTLIGEGFRISIRTGSSEELYQELLLDELDVIVAGGLHQASSHLEYKTLFSEPHVLVMPKDLADRKPVWNWEDLQYCEVPLIRRPINPESAQDEKLLALSRRELPNQFSVDDTLLGISLVEAGMGWAIAHPLTVLQVKRQLENCTLLPAPQPCENRELFVVRRTITSTNLADSVRRTFLTCLREDIAPAIARAMPWAVKDLVIARDSD